MLPIIVFQQEIQSVSQLKNFKFKYRNLKRAHLKITKICKDYEKKIQEQRKIIKALIQSTNKNDQSQGNNLNKDDSFENTQIKRYKSVNYLNQRDFNANILTKSENQIQQTQDETYDIQRSTFQQLAKRQNELQEEIDRKNFTIDNKTKIIEVQNQEIHQFVTELRNVTIKSNQFQNSLQIAKEVNEKQEQTIQQLQTNLQQLEEQSNEYQIQLQSLMVKFEKNQNDLKKFQDQALQSDEKAQIFNAQIDTHFEKHDILLIIRRNFEKQLILQIESQDNDYQIQFKDITRIEKNQNNKIRIFQKDIFNKEFTFKLPDDSKFYETFQKFWKKFKKQTYENQKKTYNNKTFFKKLSNIFFQLILSIIQCQLEKISQLKFMILFYFQLKKLKKMKIQKKPTKVQTKENYRLSIQNILHLFQDQVFHNFKISLSDIIKKQI